MTAVICQDVAIIIYIYIYIYILVRQYGKKSCNIVNIVSIAIKIDKNKYKILSVFRTTLLKNSIVRIYKWSDWDSKREGSLNWEEIRREKFIVFQIKSMSLRSYISHSCLRSLSLSLSTQSRTLRINHNSFQDIDVNLSLSTVQNKELFRMVYSTNTLQWWA